MVLRLDLEFANVVSPFVPLELFGNILPDQRLIDLADRGIVIKPGELAFPGHLPVDARGVIGIQISTTNAGSKRAFSVVTRSAVCTPCGSGQFDVR